MLNRARLTYLAPFALAVVGAMIALAAAMRWQRGTAAPTAGHAFDVRPRWPLVAA